MTAMKQILLKNAIKCSNNSNCNTFDEDITLSLFSFAWPSKKILTDSYDPNYDNENINKGIMNR